MSRNIRKIVRDGIRYLPKPLRLLLYDYRAFRKSYYEDAGFWKYIINRFVLKHRSGDYYVKSKNSVVYGNILMGKNVRLGLRGGCYIQGQGRLFVGDYTEITQNCIIISANHDLYNQEKHLYKETIIGDHCWIGSNACIMAGVVLGPRTIVGAGAVVTKSFPDGFCVIAGNPAVLKRKLDPQKFVPRKYDIEHYGYIISSRFPQYREKYLTHIKFKFDLSKVTSNLELIKNQMSE